jgi:predicted  nucleic acid-binding Zn-ribbon protein
MNYPSLRSDQMKKAILTDGGDPPCSSSRGRLGEKGQEAASDRINDVESSIRDVVSRDIRAARKAHPEIGETDDAKSMVQRLSTESIGEVERVIGELTKLKDMLRSEGERVQREISNYQALSEVAMTSIADSLEQWQRQQQRLVAEGFRDNWH